jgi:hypothetical protein
MKPRFFFGAIFFFLHCFVSMGRKKDEELRTHFSEPYMSENGEYKERE